MEPAARAALYQALDSSRSEIRLLRIHQNTDNGTVLHCDMTTISLDDSTLDYHALSYMWGPPDVSQVNSVLVNAHKAVITPNLWLALNHLDKHRYYWIDFLCINQDDLDERASQVTMMTRIYNTATIVEAWLGPEDELNRKGMELLNRYNFLQRRPNGSRDTTSLWDPYKSDLWEGLCHILENPYWTRTWIIQEIIVAKSSNGALLRICNRCFKCLDIYWMLWDTAIGFKDFLSKTERPEGHKLSNFQQISTIALRLHSLGKIPQWLATHSDRWKDGCLSDGIGLDLASLLACYSGQKCVNPRDHVYALLGFSAKHNGSDLEINYKQSVDEVYISTAVYVIRASNTLNILTFVQPRIDDGGDGHILPTWVPDWRCYDSSNKTMNGHNSHDWKCSDNLPPSYRYSPCKRSLFAIGVNIGTVSSLEPQTLSLPFWLRFRDSSIAFPPKALRQCF